MADQPKPQDQPAPDAQDPVPPVPEDAPAAPDETPAAAEEATPAPDEAPPVPDAAPAPVLASPDAAAPMPPTAPAPLPPGQPVAPPAPGTPGTPGAPAGYYPQEAYYAPGWTQAATQPRSRRGQKIALFAALAVVVLAVIGTVAAAGLYWWGTKPVGDVTSATSATSRQVRPGHCIRDLPADGSVGNVTLVPCTDEHEAEVVGSLRLDDGGWPGDDALAEQAAGWCEMSTGQAEAGYQPVVWTPGEQAWTQGDRVALCLAWLDD